MTRKHLFPAAGLLLGLALYPLAMIPAEAQILRGAVGSTDLGPGSGTVTSVALAVSSPCIFGVIGSPVVDFGTLGLTTTGISGGVSYFSTPTTLCSSGLLGASQLVLGGGAGAAPATPVGLGTTATVLHGNASGPPSFGAVRLTADVTGVLPLANGGRGVVGIDYAAAPTGSANTPLFNNGSGGFTNGTRTGTTTEVATATGTFTAGHVTVIDINGNLLDGGVPPGGGGGGSVTSVGLSVPASSIFSVTNSPVTGADSLNLLTSGTSGGLAYFSSTTQVSASGALTANAFLTGGGVGAPPNAVPITGLVLGNGASAPTAYGGAVCTNQFIRSLSASGAPACAKVDLSTDVTGTLPGGLTTPGGVSGQIEWNNDNAFDGAYLGTGLNLDTTAKVLSLTSVLNDQTGAAGGNYTVLTGDAAKTVLVTGGGTTTLPQAGTTGFTTGWSSCVLNAGSGNSTLSTTTSLFNGAGGATAMTLRPGDWACPASDGTDYPTLAGSSSTGTATPGGTSGQMQWNNASAFDGFDAGTGLTLDTTAKQLKLTSVGNDQTGAAGGNYTILTGDASKTVLVAGGGTTTLAQAGATGFDSGWSSCILNAGSSNTTLSTTISAFEGAGGGSTLTIRKNDWACPASDGANYTTVYGFSGLGLTANGVLYGGGNTAAPSATAAGSSTQVLHGGSPPTFGAIANADLTNSAITLNAGTGVGITAPGAMSLGSTYTFGATSDQPQFAGLGLGGAATGANRLSLYGSTSGRLELKVPAIAGTNAITFPAGTIDFTATGGTSQVVKQTSAGGAFTVGQLACADVSNAGTGCSASARNAIKMQAQWVTGAIVANGTIYLAYKAPYGGTVDSLDYFTGNGSYTVAIKINGTNVTGLSAVAVSSSTPANTAASGANTFSVGDKITAVISAAASSPTDALINLNVTWN